MKVTIYPSPCGGEIKVPPAKSLSHRYLIAAALSSAVTTLHNLYLSKDILETLNILGKLNVDFQVKGSKLLMSGNEDFPKISETLLINESASTLRLLIPLLSLVDDKVSIRLGKSLTKRSLDIYRQLWKQKGLYWALKDNTLTINGKLTSGKYQIKSSIASQFINGLLFVLPLLQSQSTINIVDQLDSFDYIDMTIHVLKEFGIDIIKVNENKLVIPAPQIYLSPENIMIESDYSQAANFLVLSAINSTLTIYNMPEKTLQGSSRIINILEDKAVKIENDSGRISVLPAVLNGSTIDLSNCQDLAPIVCVLAACCKEKTLLLNTRQPALKEADRFVILSKELGKLGIKIKVGKNSVVIYPWDKKSCKAQELESYNDHRITMALAILATIAPQPLTINNCQAVEKSYPSFFEDLAKVGIKHSFTK